jgi:hypothetical protein
LWVSAGDSLFGVMLKVLSLPGVLLVTLSVRNSYRKKTGGVRCGDRGGQRPRPAMRSPEKSCKKVVVFAVWAVAPSCGNQQSRHSLPAEQWIGWTVWIIFLSNCLLKEQWSHNSFSRHCAPNTNLWRTQRIFMQYMWIFVIPYSTVFTVNVSTKMDHASSVKENRPTRKPLLVKKLCCWLQNYLAVGSQENWIKSRNLCWTSQQRLEVSIAAGVQLLMCLFQYLCMSDLWVASYKYSLYKPCEKQFRTF